LKRKEMFMCENVQVVCSFCDGKGVSTSFHVKTEYGKADVGRSIPCFACNGIGYHWVDWIVAEVLKLKVFEEGDPIVKELLGLELVDERNEEKEK